MAKKTSLLSKASEKKATHYSVHSGQQSWHEKLREKEPALMEQMDELVIGYLDGKLPAFENMSQLLRFLEEEKVLTGISPDRFRCYVRYIQKTRE